MAAWLVEKFRAWSQLENGDLWSVYTREQILDNIMLYWLPASGASSARLYWESFGAFAPLEIELPVAVSAFPREILPTPRKWAERNFKNLIHWGEMDKGGHFAAWEQPELLSEEVRTGFRSLR